MVTKQRRATWARNNAKRSAAKKQKHQEAYQKWLDAGNPPREIVTRDEAVKRGLLKYFSGKACVHGHYSERNINDRICSECTRIYQAGPEYKAYKAAYEKEYNQTSERKARGKARWQNPEYRAARLAYHAGPEGKAAKAKYNASSKGKTMTKAYNDRQESRAARTAYRLSPEGKAHFELWRNSPEGKAVILANNAKRRALHRDRTVPLTKVEKRQIAKLYAEAIRLSAENGEAYHVDHKTPLCRGGLHTVENLWVVPMLYNLSKKDMTVEEYEAYLATGERTRHPIV
ncbi:MAG TPA: HNH endonuclease signature motif containing protein [Candidatus Saccharimonadia bacterium]|nr:HNH endonuclease signature motif containing protein [Candidatus Saccharimonadia bacterium]